MAKFPFYKQPDAKDCGPTCIKIIAKYYGKNISLQTLRKLSETTRRGSSLLFISDTAEKIGFRTIGVKLSIETLKKAKLPCILYFHNDHFVVLYKIKKNKFFISDPDYGLINYTIQEFQDRWVGNKLSINEVEGIALLIEPTPKFYIEIENSKKEFGFSFLLKYLYQYKSLIFQLILGLLAGSLLQLLVPFLTQSLVDVGIKNQDINFVYLILFAQITLFIGRSAIEVIRSWILLHLSTRINISLISDFFMKLMNLPIAFFDNKMTGDILQRINDHQRIENILTTYSLNVLFSGINFLVFSFVLLYYSTQIFIVFLIGSIIYFLWIIIFLEKRRELDYKKFSELSKEQSLVIEIINGMQEIKLHNAEKQKRWRWEHLQARLFNVSIKSLALEQYQSVGSNLLNELKNIIITILSAKLVIDGNITLGMMLAISYIVGQLNSPIQQFIIFIKQFQDAKISLERLGEIHEKDDEENYKSKLVNSFKETESINIENIKFRYQGSKDIVLNNLTFTIPSNKITAIVGVSGSGKTTLMKLLLKFYKPNFGKISIGNLNLNKISSKKWRETCGVVMQDGYIFNDTIANNIAIGNQEINNKKLQNAIKIANIKPYIDSLPLGLETKIGIEGKGLSSGQKQRLLIARSVYKNPKFLFFDEATSSLDANNEKKIMQNLNLFFENKTVVIIAHRLSTVKNADQIVVLDNGRIIEKGTHTDLVNLKGKYFELVKNQLELGN